MRHEDMSSRPVMNRTIGYGAFDIPVQQASDFASLRVSIYFSV